MRVDEVEAGMTGYGLSVFHGTKIERFEVEVISILRNQMGPKRDVVLIRCRGQGLEHSGAVAGMSGSPIFLVDKQGRERMIGAFALGWEFSKDPIAGVRPIEEMLAVPTEKPPVLAGGMANGGRWNALPAVLGGFHPQPATPVALPSDQQPGQLTRLSLPLVAGGVSARFLESMRPHLAGLADGLTLLQAGGAGDAPAGAEAELEPGSAIAIPIVRGDLDLAAIGTVTEVIGDRVFAFGHEFNAEGTVDLPMGVGFVHTVIPNTNMSFKLGALLKPLGSIYSDEAAAVAGQIGPMPVTIPIELAIDSPRRPGGPRTYRFDVVRHPRFTPLGAMMAINSAVMGNNMLPEEFTIQYTLDLEFENGQRLKLENASTSLTNAMELGRDLTLPLQLAMENPFARTYLKRVTGSLTIEPAAKLAIIETIQPARTIYKPGETVRLFVTTRPWKGRPGTRSVDFKLPDDLPDGPYTLTVSDAMRYVMDQTRYAPYLFHADNVEEVFDVARGLMQADSQTLYLRLATQREGLSIGRQPLADLPGSKRRVLGQPGRPDVQQYTPTHTSQLPWGMSISGAVDLELAIARDPSKAPRPNGMPVPSGPQGQPPGPQVSPMPTPHGQH